ncbi:Gnk2-homologous domain [Dillenia turbinata]|uniref:Gnk2-homologous domain n=1 Tax=Dillenia turbinata TaxID=194707 RepID=A0AAN8W256_9MAGN
MGLLTKIFSLLSLSLSLISITMYSTSADYTNLVYKGCADQKFPDPSEVYTQTLKALFDSLISQSQTNNFYKTTAGSGQSAITGLFQCRGDLSTKDCSNCVNKLPEMSNKVCGKTVAARVQLSGCYLRYEIEGFRTVSATEMLYKFCGSSQVSESGFVEKRETAFQSVESGVQNSGGFYAASYESLFVLGQCEGDLGSGDCGECVKSALQRAQVECENSISAQVYLQMCYISYRYYPNGVPNDAKTSSSSGSKQNTQKTVAIVVGGVAAVGFGLICISFARTAMKKSDIKFRRSDDY